MNIKAQSVNGYSNNAIGSEAMNYAAECYSCSTCTYTCISTAVEAIK